MFSTIPNLTEMCTALSDYDQRRKSQHGINKLEILHYVWFMDVGFIRWT